MATIDVREEKQVDKIIFADMYNGAEGDNRAYVLSNCREVVYIADGICGVDVTSEEHALNLIKALEKAIELGWWRDK